MRRLCRVADEGFDYGLAEGRDVRDVGRSGDVLDFAVLLEDFYGLVVVAGVRLVVK